MRTIATGLAAMLAVALAASAFGQAMPFSLIGFLAKAKWTTFTMRDRMYAMSPVAVDTDDGEPDYGASVLVVRCRIDHAEPIRVYTRYAEHDWFLRWDDDNILEFTFPRGDLRPRVDTYHKGSAIKVMSDRQASQLYDSLRIFAQDVHVEAVNETTLRTRLSYWAAEGRHRVADIRYSMRGAWSAFEELNQRCASENGGS